MGWSVRFHQGLQTRCIEQANQQVADIVALLAPSAPLVPPTLPLELPLAGLVAEPTSLARLVARRKPTAVCTLQNLRDHTASLAHRTGSAAIVIFLTRSNDPKTAPGSCNPIPLAVLSCHTTPPQRNR